MDKVRSQGLSRPGTPIAIEHLPPADLDELAARVSVLRKLRLPDTPKRWVGVGTIKVRAVG